MGWMGWLGRGPEDCAECSDWNIVPNVPTGTFCAYRNMRIERYVQSHLSNRGGGSYERRKAGVPNGELGWRSEMESANYIDLRDIGNVPSVPRFPSSPDSRADKEQTACGACIRVPSFRKPVKDVMGLNKTTKGGATFSRVAQGWACRPRSVWRVAQDTAVDIRDILW